MLKNVQYFCYKTPGSSFGPWTTPFLLVENYLFMFKKSKKKTCYIINKLNVFADKIGWARGADSAG